MSEAGMLTVKFLRHGPDGGERKTYTDAIAVRTTDSVRVDYLPNLRAKLLLGEGESAYETTVGANDCDFDVAYVMNEAGAIVETIR